MKLYWLEYWLDMKLLIGLIQGRDGMEGMFFIKIFLSHERGMGWKGWFL
jgi:hypothetical protein